jgi:hypothetical protein
MTILDEIFAHKSEEVERRRRDLPLQEVRALAERGQPLGISSQRCAEVQDRGRL